MDDRIQFSVFANNFFSAFLNADDCSTIVQGLVANLAYQTISIPRQAKR
jgi:hypothetical protein